MANKTDKLQHPTFHEGELVLQERIGVREKLAPVGQQFIRNYMPDQHRDFFAHLPFLIVGSVDEQGWPWTSILPGKPGFAQSHEPTELTVDTPISTLDPLHANLKPQAKLGLLGLDLSNRRRNRMNATVTTAQNSAFSLSVDQSFGNCPKYIQTREFAFVREPGTISKTSEKDHFSALDQTARELIKNADTFFVSSYVFAENTDKKDIQGVDASHRGGKPGFIKLENNSLTIPDYFGNNFFNTLGNFYKNPKAGLTFIDFERGDVLMLTGTVEILWDDTPDIQQYAGAERAWTFQLDHGIWLKDFLPFRAALDELSPFLANIGAWPTSGQLSQNAWQPLRIERIVQESSLVKSFYLSPLNESVLPDFKAGQHLPLRISAEQLQTANTKSDKPAMRTYTLSRTLQNNTYRLSIKREPQGQVSQWLHDHAKPGDIIECQQPRGEFYIDTSSDRPVVLLAGGIGITPMLAIAETVIQNNLSSKAPRNVTLFYVARSAEERAFYEKLQQLEQESRGTFKLVTLLSQPHNETTSYDYQGHLSANILQQHLTLDDYECYLCGPAAFMQNSYDILISLGVQDHRIFAEAFGPAELQRSAAISHSSTEPVNIAEEASVYFMNSSQKHSWNKGDSNLLEFAEKNNISADFSCRNGSCGSCVTKLVDGEVVYTKQPSAPHADDEVLICCAAPKQGCNTLKLAL